MTLTEHARKVYEKMTPGDSNYSLLGPNTRLYLCTMAYGELRAELDTERAKPKADPDLDRIKQKLAEARDALGRIRVVCGDDPYGAFVPDIIANRAVKVIKEHQKQQFEPKPEPDPPKKAVYEWQEWVLLRNGQRVGLLGTGLGVAPQYSWQVFRGLQLDIRGRSATLPLAKAAVEAVVRAHYGDAA